MALFKNSDIEKPKYIVAICNDIANKNSILMADGENYVLDYDSKIKQLEKVATDPAKYKALIYQNKKYTDVFHTGNKVFYFSFIDKSPYSKMGSSLNSLGKKLADAAEKATITAIESFIKGKTLNSPFDTNEKIFVDNPDAFLVWKKTFDITPKIIEKIIKFPLNQYEIFHDGSSNEMSKLVDKIIKAVGGSKDSWNPADIWLIKRQNKKHIFNKFYEILNSSHDSKSTLINSTIIELYESGDLYPIYLKQITGIGSYELTNLSKTDEKDATSLV